MRFASERWAEPSAFKDKRAGLCGFKRHLHEQASDALLKIGGVAPGNVRKIPRANPVGAAEERQIVESRFYGKDETRISDTRQIPKG